MSVEFCSGDIFATPEDVALAHGCNCAGAMGKGIAVEFKRRWPAMYKLYKARCQDETFGLGDVFPWPDPASPRIIYNLGTQRSWRTKATLAAVEAAITNLLAAAAEHQSTQIALPLIGVGLGGLPAAEVKLLLQRAANDSPIQLIVCETFESGKTPTCL
ncbi:macro domain-containing protein [Blastopirellula retiformator]|uniref:Macro domain protein n=1 Tax=Blastopirellula retiformator TaxID=2527970 RepID=A0A5C5VBH6_9BACT|nr:macro domain-containing protein [Blastopirellula retiformator]TWT34955.1 Macro domain protein [Blastopirellula retiformator]